MDARNSLHLDNRLAITGDEVANVLGISPRLRRSWSEAGKLPAPAIREGKVTRWAVDELRAWLAAGAPDRNGWIAMRAMGESQ